MHVYYSVILNNIIKLISQNLYYINLSYQTWIFIVSFNYMKKVINLIYLINIVTNEQQNKLMFNF